MAKSLHTGKINVAKTIQAFVVGIILSFIIGAGYGFLMEICAFIILDVLILFLVLGMLIATVSGMIRWGKIRNKNITYLLCFVISFTSWYTSWNYLVNNHFFADFFDLEDTFSHITRYLNRHSLSIGKFNSGVYFEIEGIGMWILSGIEALLFMIPVFPRFRPSKAYFCESCQKFNVNQKFYIHAPYNPGMLESVEKSGNFKELDQFPRFKNLPETHGSLLAIDNVYEMDLSYCNACKLNGVINIDRGIYDMDDKTQKVRFDSNEKVIQDLVIDNFSLATFMKVNKTGNEFPF
jgi:hypothetical protein